MTIKKLRANNFLWINWSWAKKLNNFDPAPPRKKLHSQTDATPQPKGGFYSERSDEFVISPNRGTKLFSWAKILNFFILNGSNHVK